MDDNTATTTTTLPPILATSVQYPPFPGLVFMNPSPPLDPSSGSGTTAPGIDVPIAYDGNILEVLAKDEQFLGVLVGLPSQELRKRCFKKLCY